MDESEIRNLFADKREAYDEAMRVTARRSEAWTRRMAFYVGDHYEVPVRNGQAAVWAQKDPRASREKIQKCRNIARIAAMRYLSAWPQIDLYPSRSGVVGQYAARNMRALAKAWHRTGVIEYKKVYLAALDANIRGISYLKVCWNPYRGPRNPAAQLGDSPFLGDMQWQYVPGLDIGIDPRAGDADDARYIAHRRSIPMDTFKETFQTDIFGRPIEQYTLWGSNPDSVPAGAYENDPRTNASMGGYKNNELVEVVEMWVRPTPMLPRGALLVFTGKTPLAFPQDDQGMPETPYDDPWLAINGVNLVPGLLGSDGAIEDVINLQKVLNHTITKQREALNWAATPALLVPERAGIQRSSITDVAGGIIRYAGVQKPEWMAGPGPTQGSMAFASSVADHLRDTSGQADAAQGISDSANTSGKLMNIQTANNLALMWPEMAMFREQLKRAYMKTFRLAGQRYDDGRIVQMVGPNGRDIMSSVFQASEFDTEAGFVIDPTVQDTASREMKFQAAAEVLAQGGFADTPDAERFRKVTGEYWDDMDQRDPEPYHHERAEREDVDFLLRGIVPQIASQDDDKVHLLCHEKTSVSPEFFALDPTLQAEHLAHIQAHQIQLQQKEGGGMPGQQSQPMPGQPPPPSMPGAPGSPGLPTGTQGPETPESGGGPSLGSQSEMGQDQPMG